MLADVDMGAEPDHPVQPSSVEISLFGARSQDRTRFAALKAMRHQHPVLVHALCTYLSVSWFLVAAIVAPVIKGR
ncbi:MULTISPECIES: hypothetical protein [unclassified Streptomyces]|uniref:hypothetical protein n=1 Tax=unclassified Streptomyces TaxID=2593676 RepID=UPI00381F21E9